MHVMEFPRKVILGEGVLSEIKTLVKSYHFEKPLVLSGKKTLKLAGREIVEILECENLMIEDSKLSRIRELSEPLRKEGFDVLISVGGGRIMDASKLLAAFLNLSWLSVPTSPSNDSMSSQAISYLLSKELEEKGIENLRLHTPLAILIDIRVVAKAPYRMLASGYGDLISNYTAVKDWELAHRVKGEYFSDYASALSLMSAKLVIERAKLLRKNYREACRVVIKGLGTSGVAMSIAGSSRPSSGSEHLFSHALDLLGSKAMHGEQCGVGTIMMMRLHGDDWRSVRETLKLLGAPVDSKGLSIDEDLVVEALEVAPTLRDRYTILSEEKLTRSKAKKLAEETQVI
ncbi:MAG: sn-glycerol-1-phosphate dehydrogenase [Candidatus Methanofastidiosia archaeon]